MAIALASVDRLLGSLAAEQHGVVSRRQLLARGVGRRAIEHRLSRGRLHSIYAGVYAVGHPILTIDGRRMAAVLSAGPDAVLSHVSAAALWQLVRGPGLPCEVTVPRNLRSRPGLRRHRGRLRRDEISDVRGIPTTGPSRTLLDLAAVIEPVRLEGAIRETEVLRLEDSVSLLQLIERYPRRKGTAALRRILERGLVGRGRTRSELEDRFLEFVEELGLPRPQTNALVETGDRVFEVDCVWWKQRLAVELDGRAAHDTSHSFETDRERETGL